MRTSIIVAYDQNYGIGYQGDLPWHLPADLKMVRERTMGHHLIMGRKTYESIGKPLPGRTSIIVTRNREYQAEGSLVVHSLADGLALAESRGEDEAFIFGGSQIYQEALPLSERLYITHIHAGFPADTHFPEFSRQGWIETHTEFHPADENNPHPFTFLIYERKA